MVCIGLLWHRSPINGINYLLPASYLSFNHLMGRERSHAAPLCDSLHVSGGVYRERPWAIPFQRSSEDKRIQHKPLKGRVIYTSGFTWDDPGLHSCLGVKISNIPFHSQKCIHRDRNLNARPTYRAEAPI